MWVRYRTSQVLTVVKNLPDNAGGTRGMGSILGSERSPGVGNGNPLQCSCLGNPMIRGSWWATVHGVTKSQTWLSTHAYGLDKTAVVRPEAHWKAACHKGEKQYVYDSEGVMLACVTACLTSCILSFLLKKSGCAHLSIPSFSEILNLYYHRIFIVTCPFFFFEDAYMTTCYARRKPNMHIELSLTSF